MQSEFFGHVVIVLGAGAPTVSHRTLDCAVAESERLARSTGKTAIVAEHRATSRAVLTTLAGSVPVNPVRGLAPCGCAWSGLGPSPRGSIRFKKLFGRVVWLAPPERFAP